MMHFSSWDSGTLHY
jgi:hypothetical protein